MKHALTSLQLTLAVVALAAAGTSSKAAVRWDGVFLETRFLNTANTIRAGSAAWTNFAVAMSNGGNVTNYPGPSGEIPSANDTSGGATRTIELRQSAIGHAFTAIAPGPLIDEGFRLLKSAVGYTDLNSTTADHRETDRSGNYTPWDLKIPGMVNPLNGHTYFAADETFKSNLSHQAADYYRAALHVDAFNEAAANGLLRTYYERMVAYTFAGHNGNERAAKVRLDFGVIDAEIALLEDNALPFYTQATHELNVLTERPVEAALFDGSYLHIRVEVLSANRNRLLEAYARALAHQADTVFQFARLKQFNGYANPLLQPAAFQSTTMLADEIDRDSRRVKERELLLMLAPEELTPITASELGRVRYIINRIHALESSIRNGQITFAASYNDAGTSDEPVIRVDLRSYNPDFVPFHALTQTGQKSHEQFSEIASPFLSSAEMLEKDAKNYDREFDVRQDELNISLRALKSRYATELGLLCGWIGKNGDGTGELVPDVVLALYPLDQRVTNHQYNTPPESLGEIGAQWGRITTAEGDLQLAYSDLEATYSQMAKKVEVATEIASGIENLARMFLENGEILEGLDLSAGKLQAEAAIARAKASQSSGFLSGLKSALGVVANLTVAYFTGGVSEAALASPTAWAAFIQGGGILALTSGWLTSEANNMNRKVGNIEADLALNVAEINAQRTRIATLEKAAVQFQQRDQLLLQTEEALHALFLQAERQKLTILLMEQHVGWEVLALQNLIGRVQFLLQEYTSALALENANPLRSPDFRLVRDIILREAEGAFHLAHRWVYFAAKSAEYRINNSRETGTNRNLISRILRARNVSTLNAAMTGMNDTLNGFYVNQGREISHLEGNYISFRNHLIQRNVSTNGEDIAVPETQPGADEDSLHFFSAKDWLQFLRVHTKTNSNGIREKLVIPFSTSLNQWPPSSDATFKNPLYANDTHNDALATTNGIEIQILGAGINMGGLIAGFRLEYAGVSAMRTEECVGGVKQVRYWKIRRPDGAPYETEGIPGVGLASNWGTGATGFNEFSPANDRWILIFDATSGQRAAGNGQLLEQLEQITDIRIKFWTSYFAEKCP